MNSFNNMGEAAKKLKISVQTLRKIIRSGEIEYIQICKRKKISDEQIASYINKQIFINKN